MTEILNLVEGAQTPVRWVIVDASQIHNMDYTAGKTLLQLLDELNRRGVGIGSVAVPEGVHDEIVRYRSEGGQYEGHKEIFLTVDDAIDALRDLPPPAPKPLAGPV
jgi:MFS superfamily sulfate permease-like transporter